MKLSERVLRATARRLEFRQGVLVPEAVVTYAAGWRKSDWYPEGGYELHEQYLADLMWVTKANYATEFEIKTSRADWRDDNDKGKWGLLPPWITRFIYVVPAELGIPDFVQPFAGVWHWRARSSAEYRHAELTVARAPKKIGQTKVPDDVRERWLLHLHCRFWYQRLAHGHNAEARAA